MFQGLLIIALIAGTLLFPTMAAAQNEPLAYAEEQTMAPSVVRQGDFALRLVTAFNLPASEDEEAAARALTALGILPPGGWVADQPMTPRIVAELRDAVVAAVAAGRLIMDLDAAMRAFTELVAEFGLPLPADQAPGYASGGAPVSTYAPYCNGTAFDYYYGSFGAPIYTYCRPPPAYFYLYSWVPYSFYWHRQVFAGFFILKHVDGIPRARHGDHRDRFKDGHDGKKRDPDHKFYRAIRSGPTVPPKVNVTPGIGRSDSPGIGRSDSPGIGRSDTPGIGHNDSPGIGRSDSPGIGRSETPGIGRDTPNHRVRTGERSASKEAHYPRHLTPAIPAGSSAKDGAAKRWLAPAESRNPPAQPSTGRRHSFPPSHQGASGHAPVRAGVTPAPAPVAAPLAPRRSTSRETSGRGSSDGHGAAMRWRLGSSQ